VRRIASLALLLPALAAGCGGGSAESTTQISGQQSAESMTKADYLELADTICRNHQSRREDLESQAGELGALTTKAKARQVATLLRKESDNRRAEVGEVRGLQPPTADGGAVDSVLGLVATEADVIDRWADAYDDLDAAEIRRLQIRLRFTARKAADRARAYGFEVCGQQ
jgi:hypothetical protein